MRNLSHVSDDALSRYCTCYDHDCDACKEGERRYEERLRSEGFRRGAEAAADIADIYNGVTAHPYRLGDCILGKLNLRKGKPRKNRRAAALEAAKEKKP